MSHFDVCLILCIRTTPLSYHLCIPCYSLSGMKGGGVIMWVIVIFYYKCTSKIEHIEVAHSLIMFISNLICIQYK